MYELHVDGYHTPLSATQIAELFHASRLRRHDPCRPVGQNNWQTIDELFPLLKYEASPASSIPNANSAAAAIRRPLTSALQAGWICFGLGLVLSWIFPLGNIFFSIALIAAVVAMCSHQVHRGLVLLLSTFCGMTVCALIFFAVVLGTVGAVATTALKSQHSSVKQIGAAQTEAVAQMAAINQQLQPARIQVLDSSQPYRMQQRPASTMTNRQDLAARQAFAIEQANKAARQAEMDRAARRDAVRQAEQQRDAINARQHQLEQIEQSIDYYDKLIRDTRSQGLSTTYFEAERDKLIQRRSELQF